MTETEIKEQLRSFMEEIYACHSAERAQEIRKRIHEFYESVNVPSEIDELADSGLCEVLAMMAY